MLEPRSRTNSRTLVSDIEIELVDLLSPFRLTTVRTHCSRSEYLPRPNHPR